jgi:hypothetical protein
MCPVTMSTANLVGASKVNVVVFDHVSVIDTWGKYKIKVLLLHAIFYRMVSRHQNK